MVKIPNHVNRQKLFAELHQKVEAAGCVAIAFVVGGTAAIKS